MKLDKNEIIILILIILTIVITLSICMFQKKNEKYQPSIPTDINKYLILPSLSLKELNNFALTSKSNLNDVNAFLKTFKKPVSLKSLNNTFYFSQVDIFYPEVLFRRFKEKYPNRQDFLIESSVRNEIKKTKIPTQFTLRKIQELFEILEARYSSELTIPETKEQEEKKVEMIDFSNLPCKYEYSPYYDQTFQYFTPFNVGDKDLLIKIIQKGQEEAISIRIFIRKDTNRQLEREIENFRMEMNSEIDPYINNFPNPLEGIYGVKRRINNQGLQGVTYNFEFNKIKLMGPNKGYNEFKDFIPKKKGLNEWIIQDEDEEKEE